MVGDQKIQISEKLLSFIKERVKKSFPEIRVRVFLFGSRARGDARPKSDIDLAFDIDAKKKSGFLLDFEEDAPTLLLMDIVSFDFCQPSLKESILTEGIVIYEQNTQA